MVKYYKPIIVDIKKPKKNNPHERVLELPLVPHPAPIFENPSHRPLRGVTIVKISGDEKI